MGFSSIRIEPFNSRVSYTLDSTGDQGVEDYTISSKHDIGKVIEKMDLISKEFSARGVLLKRLVKKLKVLHVETT